MSAQANLQPLVVVKLNGYETISLKDLKDSVETYQSQSGQKFNIEQKKEILESLIDQKLIIQAAKKEGIVFSDSQVDQYYLANMSQIVGRQVTEKEFADIVRQTQNMSVDEFLKSQLRMNVAQYKAYLRSQLMAQQYVLTKKQNEINSVLNDVVNIDIPSDCKLTTEQLIEMELDWDEIEILLPFIKI